MLLFLILINFKDKHVFLTVLNSENTFDREIFFTITAISEQRHNGLYIYADAFNYTKNFSIQKSLVFYKNVVGKEISASGSQVDPSYRSKYLLLNSEFRINGKIKALNILGNSAGLVTFWVNVL